MVAIFPTARLRPSPFYEAVLAEGMVSCSLYNNMLLPSSFGDPEAEYWRIIEGVSQWDVGAERQVQITGKDAARLAQILSARDISNCKEGQGKYVPICNHRGTIINDPILLKFSDEKFWFSIADSDMWLWARGIAAERGLDVEISEPDVSPMALQGPLAEDVVASVCGDWVREIKYFWFRETEVEGIPVAVQRSGWSKQGGFEIYLRDGKKGTQLWNIFKEAGQPFGIGPGGPTTAERTESGLVSVGGDTDVNTSPFEVRLDKYTNTDLDDEVIGMAALRRIKAEGPKRHMLGVKLGGTMPMPLSFAWEPIEQNGKQVGHLTNAVWSPRLLENIGYALISSHIKAGERVSVVREGGVVQGELVELPFL
ncbi:glycine cleavage T C-terminal barrel domain-containing protein [Pseudahrensia aquimaris]|uniref:Glycine cleavage T C-terminal barrel domain-containing protein n=1 Tax=Pseudahrensia aquimaris TaxID=744461 RepID=A0ABW3FA23_9HYPH